MGAHERAAVALAALGGVPGGYTAGSATALKLGGACRAWQMADGRQGIDPASC
jgi:hypothetical protein